MTYIRLRQKGANKKGTVRCTYFDLTEGGVGGTVESVKCYYLI